MERELANINAQETKPVGMFKFILGFIVFLYKTAIRP